MGLAGRAARPGAACAPALLRAGRQLRDGAGRTPGARGATRNCFDAALAGRLAHCSPSRCPRPGRGGLGRGALGRRAALRRTGPQARASTRSGSSARRRAAWPSSAAGCPATGSPPSLPTPPSRWPPCSLEQSPPGPESGSERCPLAGTGAAFRQIFPAGVLRLGSMTMVMHRSEVPKRRPVTMGDFDAARQWRRSERYWLSPQGFLPPRRRRRPPSPARADGLNVRRHRRRDRRPAGLHVTVSVPDAASGSPPSRRTGSPPPPTSRHPRPSPVGDAGAHAGLQSSPVAPGTVGPARRAGGTAAGGPRPGVRQRQQAGAGRRQPARRAPAGRRRPPPDSRPAGTPSARRRHAPSPPRTHRPPPRLPRRPRPRRPVGKMQRRFRRRGPPGPLSPGGLGHRPGGALARRRRRGPCGCAGSDGPACGAPAPAPRHVKLSTSTRCRSAFFRLSSGRRGRLVSMSHTSAESVTKTGSPAAPRNASRAVLHPLDGFQAVRRRPAQRRCRRGLRGPAGAAGRGRRCPPRQLRRLRDAGGRGHHGLAPRPQARGAAAGRPRHPPQQALRRHRDRLVRHGRAPRGRVRQEPHPGLLPRC